MSYTAQTNPRLWIVAGPNGCGKSTAYSQRMIADFDESVWIINPDLLTTTLLRAENLGQEDANLQAVKRIERWLRDSLSVYRTIGVETVLSTDKYRKVVRQAKRCGYEIHLIYVFVDTVEIQLERIRLRVEKGGHDVPPDKVRDRRHRSIAQLAWFFGQSDQVWIFDNSGAEPKLVVRKSGGLAWHDVDLLPEVGAALLA